MGPLKWRNESSWRKKCLDFLLFFTASIFGIQISKIWWSSFVTLFVVGGGVGGVGGGGAAAAAALVHAVSILYLLPLEAWDGLSHCFFRVIIIIIIVINYDYFIP